MKWLLAFTAVHGLFTTDQCRVLRQVRLAPAECHASFAAERSLAANFTRNAPAAPGAPGASPGGPSRSLGGPANGGPGSPGNAGGSPPGSSSGGGNVGNGRPGNPGGGASPPTLPSPSPSPPIAEPKPPDRTAQLEALAKLRGEIQDALRQRAIDRIINGFKPSDKPDRPNFKPPDRPGRPSSKPGLSDALGPGGLRGASSLGQPGPTRR